MKDRLASRISYANVVATIALFVALGGSSYAAISLTGKNIKDGSLTGADVKNGSLTASDIKAGSLLGKDFKAGQLPAGARGATGPTGPAGVVDTTQFYTKALSDTRYLRGGLVTVVASSGSIAINDFGSATATCPAGYQAISGGADPSNVSSAFMTDLEPVIEGTNVDALSDGQHAAPTGWRAFFLNASPTTPGSFKVAVVCAPVG